MIRCEYCLNPLQIAHKKTNDCFACKYYKGYQNTSIGLRYKLIQNILEFLTRNFPKHGDIYRE